MAKVLIVDDDADQLELRAMLLESKGHAVAQAASPAAAIEIAVQFQPQVVLMDLLLPTVEAGRALFKDLRQALPRARLVVLSGWSGEVGLNADAVLRKPAKSVQLLETVARLAMVLLVAICGVGAADFPFQVKTEAEVAADVVAQGDDGQVLEIQVDQRTPFHVVLYAGQQRRVYPVLLGRLTAGEHVARIREAGTAKASISNIREIPASDPAFSSVANAPVLFARANTMGKFSDVPLLMYVTRQREAGETGLEYTVIFSNEDGGTSTRNLMARWGRVTDIEYIYRVWTAPDGKPMRAIIQSKDHKDLPYNGRREDWHPLLVPVTDNNMVEHGEGAIRYQLLPKLVDLNNHSREQVMDEDPITYAVSARELAREGKLRPYGTVDGEKISDPRNYLVIEAKLTVQNAGVQALARVDGDDTWQAGALGLADNFINRSGWIRTAIELPPGAKPVQIAFDCLIPKKQGNCQLDAIGKVFQLERDYAPGANRLSAAGPIGITPGRIEPIALR